MSGAFHGRSPERACLKRESWPDADRRPWEEALQPGDALEPGGARSRYATISNRKVERGYGRWLTWLAGRGALEGADSPADRITRERVAAYLKDLERLGNGTQTLLARLQELYEAAGVMDPGRDWQWIRRIASRVRARHVPVRDKRARVVGNDALYRLGLELMAQADTASTERLRAIAFRDGLLIALLALRPLRLRNIAAIAIGQHLRRHGSVWILAFGEDETKTGAALEFPWPQSLIEALEHWLQRWRPYLLRLKSRWTRPTGNALWISSHGSPMSQQSIYDRVVEHTRAAFGKAVNPHLFRDCAATTLAIVDPAHVRLAAPLLGHRSFATTERYYLQANMLEASRQHQQEILHLRKSARRSTRIPEVTP
jgi:integrase/recombinase XerD